MIDMIEESKYLLVKPIFALLEEYQPMCTAVLDGIWPGKVWVDDPENPRSAMLMSFLGGGGAAWCFLTGEPENADFNAALNRIIFVEQAAGQDVSAFLFTCSLENWGDQLAVIGKPRQPAPRLRHHFVCHNLTFDWRGTLPDGYVIQPMETDLLERTGFKLPEQVKSTLEKWHFVDDDRFQDYGFVVIHENQVVAWATVDFVIAGAGDLGFETLPEFQKRGLGSAVAAAAIEHGLKFDIKIHWTCANDNIGSQRTAQKLGLTREREYNMHLLMLDLSDNLAQLAYSHLVNGEYPKAIECYEQLFAQKADVPAWAYFDTAQACAALGEAEKALKYLHMAVKKGWTSLETIEQTTEFQIIHKAPEWIALLDQMKDQENR
jgi:RimJ/RimL family protein N-acetyltransferase